MSPKIALGFLLALSCASILVQAARKRQGPLLGGWRKMNISSTEAKEAARKATVHLDAARNSMKAYRLERLISAKSQIVAGTNYQLRLSIAQTDCNRGVGVNVENCQTVKTQRCDVTIHVPLQSQLSQLMNQSCGKEKLLNRGKTTRVPMPGSAVGINVSSDEVVQAASFATQQLTLKSNGGYQVAKQRIIKATSQVVAGVMYTFTMEVSLTYNKSNEIKKTRCEVKVWDQAWRNPRYILQKYKCNKFIA